MLSTSDAQHVLSSGGQVVDNDGDKIGKIGQVFLDDTTGEPAWVTVKTGLFGGAESFVPLERATLTGDDVSVPFDKAKVKDAPRVDDADGHLEPHEEGELYRYYGMGDTGRSDDDHTAESIRDEVGTDARVDTSTGGTNDTRTGYDDTAGTSGLTGTTTGAGHDTSGPDTDNAMTRSEEQVRVGTTTETVGKARLRKYVVTENVTQTVPVSHEEVRIEREPITDANRGDATSGGDITEEEHEVELTGERVVVDKDTVPVERVRMGTETVTEQQTVNEQVRKEQIDADQTGDQTGNGTTGTTDGTRR